MIARYLALIAFSLVLAGLSFSAWQIPFQILAPSFYESQVAFDASKLTPILLRGWFILGGYKTALIMFRDRNEAYFTSVSYMLKSWLLVPLIPIINFRSGWYKLS